MTTYSTSLKLTLPGDGELAGIWGQTTNNNLGTLLEEAIVGVVGITMLDANYTLSNLNGTTDEARQATLVVGGTNSAIRKIIAPLVKKSYRVTNNTVGGFSIQIGATTGAYIVIPNGFTALVYCNGTDFVNGLSCATDSFKVVTNLSVGGTTTLSSALTYGGVTLSNAVTGTGNMVLSASPTFTGSPIAPTQTAGDNSTKIATTAYVATAITGQNLGTMSLQNANNVAITGGTISGLSSLGVSGTATATSFSGAGTGLTGTASSLSIGGNSATTSQTNFSNLTIASSQVLSAANYNTYAPTKTGGGASGTWNINVSGNAATATTATNATNLVSTNFSVFQSGATLYFQFNGVNIAALDSFGNLTVVGDVTAYGTL